MSDPFAVTDYALDAVPVVTDRERDRAFFTRGQGGYPGFGDIWIGHAGKRNELTQLETVDYLARMVLGAYEADRWGFLDVSRAGEPGQKVIIGTPDNIARAMVMPAASLRDQQSRRLAMVTLIDHLALRGKCLSKDLTRALVRALDLQSRVARRTEASKAATIEGQRLATGASETEAVAAVMGELGMSHGKAWALRRSPLYRLRRAEAREYWSVTPRPFPFYTKHHATNAWFLGDTVGDRMSNADRVAQAVINRMRTAESKSPAGKRARLGPIELRWDVLNLLEGYHRLKHPPSETVRIALDHALGLSVLRNKQVSLAGVRDRETFMAAALVEASQGSGDPQLSAEVLLEELDQRRPAPDVLTNVETVRDWRRMPLYRTAVEELRKAR